jgi:hypothetical protein
VRLLSITAVRQLADRDEYHQTVVRVRVRAGGSLTSGSDHRLSSMERMAPDRRCDNKRTAKDIRVRSGPAILPTDDVPGLWLPSGRIGPPRLARNVVRYRVGELPGTVSWCRRPRPCFSTQTGGQPTKS